MLLGMTGLDGYSIWVQIKESRLSSMTGSRRSKLGPAVLRDKATIYWGVSTLPLGSLALGLGICASGG